MRFFGRQGNEYRQVIEKDFPNYCTFMATTDIFYPELLKSSTMPDQNPNMCPIKPGFYEINNLILNKTVSKELFVGIKYWRVNNEFYANKKLFLHFTLYFIID